MTYLLLLALFTVVQTQPADETAVMEILKSRSRAWDKQDVDALIAPFVDDADYVSSSGKVVEGKKAIEQMYQNIFSMDEYKKSRSKQGIRKIQFVRPDVAIVDATWTLSGVTSKEGKSLPEKSGTSVIVLTKESGEWKIVAVRTSTLSATKTQR